MTTEPEQEPKGIDRLTRLAELASEIVQELEHISLDSGEQFVSLANRARRNRQLITAVIVSVVLDVILSVFLGLAVVQVKHNEHQISALTTRLDISQTVQRQKALCPLYQIFLDSRSAAGRAAAPDPVKYDHAFQVIQDGYGVLGCAAFIAKSP